MKLLRWRPTSRTAGWLAVGVCASIAILAWLGFRASVQWQRSSLLLVQRRTDEGVRLVVTALMRDMRAVDTSVLTSPVWDAFSFDTSYEETPLLATAFARYPYPESFFAWQAATPPDRMAFFLRTDRRPRWLDTGHVPSRYPAQPATAPQIAERLLIGIQADALDRRMISVSEIELEGHPYQVVAHLKYSDRPGQQLASVAGFLVDLAWARDHYFPEFTRQMARVSNDPGLSIGIEDDRGQIVTRTRIVDDGAFASRRKFPAFFFDPRSDPVGFPASLNRRMWTVVVSGADPALAAVIRGENWTLAVAPVAAVFLVLGLLLSVRAMKASAELAEMKAEFMSSVTHELKTPIAGIRALGETLRSGRALATDTACREYGGLIAMEATRLSRLVENLLAHARVTDVADVYSCEPIDVGELVDSVIATFRPQMLEAGFSIDVSVEPDAPPVVADRTALELVMNNLVDNAIRYSGSSRVVRVSAHRRGSRLEVTVSDEGVGILKEDLERIMRKFVRGRNASAGGSGLGLAIVQRVVDDHGGAFAIDSQTGRGTTARFYLPIAAASS